MRRILALLIVSSCLVAPATAPAAARDVIRDCSVDGRIDSRHSQQDFEAALRRLPSDVDEYTECRRIIQQAQRAQAREPSGTGGGTSGAGGGPITGFGAPPPPAAPSVPANPGERGAIATVTGPAGEMPVVVAGEPITPGGSGIVESAFRHSLPAPLLVLVILFGLGALATTLSGARARGAQPPDAVLRLFDRAFPRRA